MARTSTRREAKILQLDKGAVGKRKITSRRAKKKVCEVCDKILSFARPHDMRGPLPEIFHLGSSDKVLSAGCKKHSKLVSRCLGVDLPRCELDSITLHGSGSGNDYYMQMYISGKTSPSSGFLRLASQPPSVLGGRLVNTKWIDRSLPRRWKERCNAEHTCTSPELLAHMKMHPPLWVLDTWKQCLVQCSTATPYVALSYVWGGSATLTALKDNIESLKIPGSLAEGNTKIPKTIRDAMAFVQILGERYLWVDSLCIVQDGPQKMVEVANMGVIYAQASITIVAADGDNANAGLRGLHGMSGPRSVRQVVHSLGRGASLIETHGQRIAATTSLIWKTRGWTFQEDLFSRRKVIFEKGWVRWECHEATWDEHSNANMPQPSIFDTLVPDVDYLNGIINDFNERILTFPEDALLAFSGIASALSGVFQGGFISGLPVSLLHVGLLWIPTSTSSRRLPKKAVEGVCLPSWSWAGWQGGVSLPAGMVLGYRVFHSKRWTQYTRERVSSLVEWSWANSPQGKKNRIRESWHDYREAFWNKSDTPCPPGWTRYSIRDPSSMPADDISTQPRSGDRPLCLYKHDSEHDLLFWYPPPMPQNHEPSKAHNLAQYISCRTRRGWLLLGEAIVRPMGISQYIPVVSLRDQRGTWAGALTLHEPMHNDQENDNRAGERQSMRIRLELVEIAQGNIPNDPNDWKEYIEEWKLDERPKSGALYEYFYVLWIEWKEGIAYRKGIGRVHKDTWEAQQLEWIDLVLG